jgi:ferrous iron transport protein A
VKLALAKELECDPALTLHQARVGSDLRIQMLSGPECERLRDLGFCEQKQVRKLAGGRNLICSVCGTRLAISSELAKQVLVEIAPAQR